MRGARSAFGSLALYLCGGTFKAVHGDRCTGLVLVERDQESSFLFFCLVTKPRSGFPHALALRGQLHGQRNKPNSRQRLAFRKSEDLVGERAICFLRSALDMDFVRAVVIDALNVRANDFAEVSLA